MAGITASNDDLQHDFLESVNLLVKDGLQYTYIHRSFQEFFSAYCVANVVLTKQDEILKKFAHRNYDSTLRLVYEIQPQLVEEKLLFVKYNALKRTSLPRRLNPKTPLIAVAKAGVVFHAHAHVLLDAETSEFSIRLFSFSGDFNSEYEELSSAVKVVHSKTAAHHGGLFNMVADLCISEVWEPLAKLKGGRRKYSFDNPPNARISILFSETDCSIQFSSDSVSGSDELLVEAIRPLCLALGHKLERVLLEHNSLLVGTAEELAHARTISNSALGEILL